MHSGRGRRTKHATRSTPPTGLYAPHRQGHEAVASTLDPRAKHVPRCGVLAPAETPRCRSHPSVATPLGCWAGYRLQRLAAHSATSPKGPHINRLASMSTRRAERSLHKLHHQPTPATAGAIVGGAAVGGLPRSARGRSSNHRKSKLPFSTTNRTWTSCSGSLADKFGNTVCGIFNLNVLGCQQEISKTSLAWLIMSKQWKCSLEHDGYAGNEILFKPVS